MATHGLTETASDQEWDLCDRPTKTHQAPSPKELYRYRVIDGKKSGLVKPSLRANVGLKSGLPVQINPELLPEDIRQLQEDIDTEGLKRKLKIVHLPELDESLPHSMKISTRNRMSLQEIQEINDELEEGGNSTLPYFFYGSFMFPSVIRNISNPSLSLLEMTSRMMPAVLRGYTLHAVRSQAYPAILPSTGMNDTVTGMLIFGIPDRARADIHRFENGMFDLRKVKGVCELDSGELESVTCAVYVWNKGMEGLVGREERLWSIRELMVSAWHLRNLETARREELRLSSHNIA
jgi:hypothetical protein